MEQTTLDIISLWLLDKRERFTLLLSNDTEIQTLPEHLTPENIDLIILEAYLNFSTVEQIFKNHQHDGFYLLAVYKHLFSFIGIELSSLHQAKLFFYFYRLSFHYAPTQEVWISMINDNDRLNLIIEEATNQILN